MEIAIGILLIVFGVLLFKVSIMIGLLVLLGGVIYLGMYYVRSHPETLIKGFFEHYSPQSKNEEGSGGLSWDADTDLYTAMPMKNGTVEIKNNNLLSNDTVNIYTNDNMVMTVFDGKNDGDRYRYTPDRRRLYNLYNKSIYLQDNVIDDGKFMLKYDGGYTYLLRGNDTVGKMWTTIFDIPKAEQYKSKLEYRYLLRRDIPQHVKNLLFVKSLVV